MARLIVELEAYLETSISNEDHRHHDQSTSVQTAFLKDVYSVKAAFQDIGNPFSEEGPDLVVMDTRDICDKCVVDSVMKTEELGRDQCNAFVEEQLTDCAKPPGVPIKMNKLHLFATS